MYYVKCMMGQIKQFLFFFFSVFVCILGLNIISPLSLCKVFEKKHPQCVMVKDDI